jgi:hypothetical protein
MCEMKNDDWTCGIWGCSQHMRVIHNRLAWAVPCGDCHDNGSVHERLHVYAIQPLNQDVSPVGNPPALPP